MPDQKPSPEHVERVQLEAVAWIARMNGRPSKQERTDFELWLKRDPLHLDIYDRVHALSSSAAVSGLGIAREHDPQLSRHLEALQRLRESKRATATGGMVAGCLALMIAGAWLWLEKPNMLQDLTADYSTGRGERRTVFLQDGSSVLLDADSALDIDFSDMQRAVRLMRGSAHFDVSHSEVPFVVLAQSGRSQVLGTAFDVAIGADDVSVTLERGSLRVSVGSNDIGVVLKPGEGVTYDAAHLGHAHFADLDAATAWHEGRFIFNDMPLIDVINKIGRYRSGRIVVVGEELRQLRVSGSFSLDDPDAALVAVQSTVGFAINNVANALLVIRP